MISLGIAKWRFSNSLISSTFISWHPSIKKSFPYLLKRHGKWLFFPFNYRCSEWGFDVKVTFNVTDEACMLFPSLSHYGFMNYNQLRFILLMLKWSQIWPMELFSLILTYFHHTPTGLWAPPCFLWHDRSGSLCTFPVTCLRIRHFCKKMIPLSSNQDEDVKYNCCYWSVNDSRKFQI